MTDSIIFEHNSFTCSEQGGKLIIHLKGKIDIDTSVSLLSDFKKLIQSRQPGHLVFDLEDVTNMDDYGAFLMFETSRIIQNNKGEFNIINADKNAANMLLLINYYGQYINIPTPPRTVKNNLMVRIGESVVDQLLNLRFMIAFIGSVILSFINVILSPRSFRAEDTITHMKQTGVNALPVVAMISFLLGLIIAFMSSLQLKQFGANIYVASLVAFAMVSELGPVMTAILISGRSGSAYAAEIGTMQISEEIDALFAMGFNPAIFLAVPRILASIIVVPILTLFSDFFAISGGLVIGVFMLGLTPNTYIAQTIEVLTLEDFLWGFLKSAVFALLIAMIGCLRGFRAKEGAASVGRAATSAVVSSIFMIIFFDSIFAVMRSYW